MKENGKMAPAPARNQPSSLFTLLTGWVQQGVESFFATQRILVDLAMRQNLSAMKSLREALSHPEHSPMAILTEVAAEGTNTFIEAQRILLELAQRQTDIVLNGTKERVAGSTPAAAMTDMVHRSINTFITMQEDFLTLASKQATTWLHAMKAGKPYDGNQLIEVAREAMDKFVHTQKKFLDIIAEETSRATSGKPMRDGQRKKTDISKMAREAANAFMEAQKKLLDVAGQQMNVNLQAASRTMEMLKPFRLPLMNMTGEGVKSFVDAEKALIDSMMKRNRPAPMPVRPRKPAARTRKAPRARAQAAAV